MFPQAPSNHEQLLWSQGKTLVAGIDEVGRGAWAGPMVVSAVIFPLNFTTELSIYDSKKCSAKLRESLSEHIKKTALAFSIYEASVEDINTLGLAKITQVAFYKAIQNLPQKPDHILIDAFIIKDCPKEYQTPLVKGDQQSITIAAASILAKVYRDNLMKQLHIKDPRYGYDQHVGYGTQKHRDAIKQHGLSTQHRTSYNLGKWL